DFSYSAADSTFDFLAEGQKLTVTYDVTIADDYVNSTQPVTITITGTNDDATITASTANSDIGAVTEDDSLTMSGSLTVSDVDTGENHFETPASLAGTYGDFTFNAIS